MTFSVRNSHCKWLKPGTSLRIITKDETVFIISNCTVSASFYAYGAEAGDTRSVDGDDGCPEFYDIPATVFGLPHETAYVSFRCGIWQFIPTECHSPQFNMLFSV